MKRYTVAKAREQLASVLDAAERGEGVIIERRGVSFELRPLRTARRRKPKPSLIEFVDAALERGKWSFQLGRGGLRFKAR